MRLRRIHLKNPGAYRRPVLAAMKSFDEIMAHLGSDPAFENSVTHNVRIGASDIADHDYKITLIYRDEEGPEDLTEYQTIMIF